LHVSTAIILISQFLGCQAVPTQQALVTKVATF